MNRMEIFVARKAIYEETLSALAKEWHHTLVKMDEDTRKVVRRVVALAVPFLEL